MWVREPNTWKVEQGKPHPGQRESDPEAKETIYSNIHSGFYRRAVREVGFGLKMSPHSH